MFLFEQYLKKRRRKIQAWKREGEEWVNEKNSKSGYSMYSLADYARANPSPYGETKDILTVVWCVFVGIVVSTGLTFVFWNLFTAPPKKVDPNNPNGCDVLVKKGDLVAVTAGPFEGSEGTIINQLKNCSVNLRLTKSTMSDKRCEELDYSDCGFAKDNGTILNVDTEKNIIKL